MEEMRKIQKEISGELTNKPGFGRIQVEAFHKNEQIPYNAFLRMLLRKAH